MRKAAVIIGVGKTGALATLTSAASGAEKLAAWLRTEQFDVSCLTDTAGPVTCAQIEKALEDVVTLPPRYGLLLVYFSGHGYWQARSDQWLLSGAPVKAREAINLSAAMERAKYSGIPNVVFVSDACRSIPNTRAGAQLDGSGLFPSYDEITLASKIDYFKATSEATSAWEGPVDGETQSVLTAALMSAFVKPEPYMVKQVTDGTTTVHVVPNRRLEDYLQRKVEDLLAVIDPLLVQRIEVNVPSSDDVYIATVRTPAGVPPVVPLPAAPSPAPTQPKSRGAARSVAPPAAAAPPFGSGATGPMPSGAPPPLPSAPAGMRPSIFQVVAPARRMAVAIAESLGAPTVGDAGAATRLIVNDAGLANDVDSLLPDPRLNHFETETGFGVTGASIVRVATSQRFGAARAEIVEPGDGGAQPGIVRMYTVVPASVFVQFGDGRCAVLAALPGYIGHVVCGRDGIGNISYVPSSNNPRWPDYAQRKDELDQLRAMVALAVDNNTFKVGSAGEANRLAERIRLIKNVDPTLGLYAAVAFSESGNQVELESVMRHMRDDLGVDLFDLRLLVGRSALLTTALDVIPFCPLLTDTWNLLTARQTALPAPLPAARQYLCGSLWTTFEPDAADAIVDAMRTGALS